MNRTDTVNGRNQVTATGSTGVSHDARGNISAVGSDWAAYTSENFLSAATAALILPDPRLRPLQVYNTSTGGAVRLDYLGDTLVGEYNTSNAIVRRYVPGPGTDEPVVWYEGSGTSTRQWLHADERGSVIAVSDSSGNLVGSNPNRYDEYGAPQGTLTGRFGFTGQAWLPELGLYDYRARNYHPGLGRFMQTDPIGYGAGMNLYAYVLNDPVNFIDPTGRQEGCEGCGPPPVICGKDSIDPANECYDPGLAWYVASVFNPFGVGWSETGCYVPQGCLRGLPPARPPARSPARPPARERLSCNNPTAFRNSGRVSFNGTTGGLAALIGLSVTHGTFQTESGISGTFSSGEFLVGARAEIAVITGYSRNLSTFAGGNDTQSGGFFQDDVSAAYDLNGNLVGTSTSVAGKGIVMSYTGGFSDTTVRVTRCH